MSTFSGQIDLANPRGRMDVGDSLSDFHPRDMTFDGITKSVRATDRGPAVILMPGISREVARFARRLRDAGFSVDLRTLLRRDGPVLEAAEAIS